MDGWLKYWNDGEAYLKAAKGGRQKKEKFLPEVVFNLGALAIESYFLGFLGKTGRLPEHHTFGHFVRAVSQVKPFPEDVAQILRKVDIQQNLCSLDAHQLPSVSFWEVDQCLSAADDVREFLVSLEPLQAGA